MLSPAEQLATPDWPVGNQLQPPISCQLSVVVGTGRRIEPSASQPPWPYQIQAREGLHCNLLCRELHVGRWGERQPHCMGPLPACWPKGARLGLHSGGSPLPLPCPQVFGDVDSMQLWAMAPGWNCQEEEAHVVRSSILLPLPKPAQVGGHMQHRPAFSTSHSPPSYPQLLTQWTASARNHNSEPCGCQVGGVGGKGLGAHSPLLHGSLSCAVWTWGPRQCSPHPPLLGHAGRRWDTKVKWFPMGSGKEFWYTIPT